MCTKIKCLKSGNYFKSSTFKGPEERFLLQLAKQTNTATNQINRKKKPTKNKNKKLYISLRKLTLKVNGTNLLFQKNL